MTDAKKKNTPPSQSITTPFHDPAQIREQAEQKAKAIPFPDLNTMTREEIQQMVYEMQVKQIEADLLVEQWRSQREGRDDQAELFRIVSENMLDMVALADMEGNFTFAGKSHEILGYKPGFLIGRNVMDFVHPEDLPRIKEEFGESLASGHSRRAQYRYRCKDGSYLWLETVGNFYIDKDGIPQKIVFSSRNITDRKQAEEAVEDERTYLSAVIDNIGEAIVICDAGGRITRFNETARRLHGLPEQPIPPDQWARHYDLYQEDGITPLPTEETPLYRALQGERVQNAEIVVAPKHSRPYFMVCNGQPLTDETGKKIGAVIAMHDITERKRMEQALRRERDLNQRYLDTTQTMMVALDAEGRITMINRCGRELLGYAEDEILGCNWFATCLPHPEGMDRVYPVFRRIMAGDRASFDYFENSVVCRDGTQRLMGWHNALLEDDDGRVFGTLSSGEDITERKESEMALRESQKRYRESEQKVRGKLNAILLPEGDIGMLDLADILDTEAIQDLMNEFYSLTGIGGAIVDLDGNILVLTGWQDICTKFHRVHPEACKNCIESDTILSSGIAPGQYKAYRCKNNLWDIATPILIGDKHFGNIFLGQFFYEDEEIDYGAFRAQARKYGFDEQIYMDALDRVPRFSRKAVEMTMNYYIRLAKMIATLSYSNLKLARTIEEHKRNEREREKLQLQLHQAQKMQSIGRLAGGVAHDFNNKLAIINGYAEIAMETLDPSDPLHETIQEIHTAGKQSADIVRQLLAFARKQTISPVLLDLNDTISSMLKMLQRLIGENIDLSWHPGNNLAPVEMDPSQVDQIMANLAVNARDAISDVGKLTIETDNIVVDEYYCRSNTEAIPGRYVMLAVSDDGCGIEKETREQLFDPYFTTKEIGKGTGLGLPTIYGIVKQNNGFINVYSEPGEGTTFKLYFPSHEEAKSSAHAAKKASDHIPRGMETILVVEDEKTILQMSKQMLERLGYTVETAGSAAEALQIAKQYGETIHLLITDVIMPEMNGRDLSSQLSQNHPGVKTLYMSGYTADVIAHHGVLDEGLQFIQKPFSLRDLAAKVREVLEQK